MGFFGLDSNSEVKASEVEKTVETVAEAEKPKRKFFYIWDVAGESYKLKLDSTMTCRLEEKFRQNLLNVISGDGLPPLGIMLTIIQAAMLKFQHGVAIEKVQKIYDAYVEEGGSQMKLYSDVIMGIMAVSGFFTTDQVEMLENKIKASTQLL